MNSLGVSAREVDWIDPFMQRSRPFRAIHNRLRALWASRETLSRLKAIRKDHGNPYIDAVLFLGIFEARNENLTRVDFSAGVDMLEAAGHRCVSGHHFDRITASSHHVQTVVISGSTMIKSR